MYYSNGDNSILEKSPATQVLGQDLHIFSKNDRTGIYFKMFSINLFDIISICYTYRRKIILQKQKCFRMNQ